MVRQLAIRFSSLPMSVPKWQVWRKGGEEMRRCTSLAPARRIDATMRAQVVPRTMESSTSTTRFPSTAARRGVQLQGNGVLPLGLGGKIKLRPMYRFFTKAVPMGMPLSRE